MTAEKNAYWSVKGDGTPVLMVLDVAALARDLQRSAAQKQYDDAHDPSDFHCLPDPCPWHPFETRMGPRPTYPATLNTRVTPPGQD